jgi:hypothetical protein
MRMNASTRLLQPLVAMLILVLPAAAHSDPLPTAPAPPGSGANRGVLG